MSLFKSSTALKAK